MARLFKHPIFSRAFFVGAGFLGANLLKYEAIATNRESDGAPRIPNAADSPAKQGARIYSEILEAFCNKDWTESELLQWLAPNGHILTGGVRLEGGKPFLIRNNVMRSLHTGAEAYAPFAQVVWWTKPASIEAPPTEVHFVPDAGGTVVSFDEFLTAHPFGQEISRSQGHPLANIQHSYSFPCDSGRLLTVEVGEVVWAGEYIGKIGELIFKSVQ